MANTISNSIPFVPEGTTDPAAGLNDSLNVIDPLLQTAVLAIQNTPPGSPANGDLYIVGTSPTGAWVGHANKLARWLNSAWDYRDARIAVNLADNTLRIRGTSGWISV